MIKNYFKIAFRNILRHKAYSFINISGLAIGMASSILILLWVQNELSYDRFHKNADQIYRITCNASDFKAAVNPAGMPAGLKSGMPVIKNYVRLSHQSTNLFEVGDHKFEEKRVFYADSTFLEVFSFPLVEGNSKTALQRADGVLITKDMAKKYFGNKDAMGQTLRKDNGSNLTVTGVPANIPSNSHLQFDFILPMSSIAQSDYDLKNNIWDNFNYYSYVQLDKNFVPSVASLAKLNNQMDGIYKKHIKETELKQNPLTSHFTIISDLPTNLASGTVNIQWEGKDPNSQTVFPSMDVSEDFIDVFQMKILNGRSFSTSFKADSNNYIVNEKALQVIGMKAATIVGKPLSFNDRKGVIIGVVKDFNFKPIPQPIEPLILRLNRGGGTVVIRTQAGSTESTIRTLGQISHQLNPAYPFTYNFLDQDLANLYKGEQRLGKLFNLFAILAIFISCLGLYGLSAFMAEQRTKEIGVRKVLGASVFKIVYLLSTGFTRLILIATAIAVPVSWWAINSWLQGFAYHIQISWIIFLVASMAALLIAWLTVSYESVKAAITNPVKSLRTE
jgi:ABC-type antimicrobial peptide transport system permease subunit